MLAVAQAAVLRTVAPVAVAPAPVLAKQVELEEVDPHPQYSYSYDVQDTLSGDSKGHVEERDGDIVRGEYSLRVLSTDHITITFLDLALGVAGEGILDIVGVLVLRMGIVFLGSLGDHMLGNWGNGLDNGSRGGIGGHSWSCMVDLSSGQDAGAGSGDQSENCDELKII